MTGIGSQAGDWPHNMSLEADKAGGLLPVVIRLPPDYYMRRRPCPGILAHVDRTLTPATMLLVLGTSACADSACIDGEGREFEVGERMGECCQCECLEDGSRDCNAINCSAFPDWPNCNEGR